jgi:NAD(P)-dependent dehydrogenase (short-subunit alcohol dehydrogenase family)
MSTPTVPGKGRTALVTGASRGIGPLIAREIARQGGHVVLTGRSAADLKVVTADLATAGADVSFIPADLTQPGAAETLVETIEQQRGGIDLLVNNAGGDPLREFHTMTIEENLRTLRLNLIAPLALTHAALDGMLRRGRGHIVNISAMAGRVAFPYTEVYAAAKDGLIGFTRVQGRERVRVTLPGDEGGQLWRPDLPKCWRSRWIASPGRLPAASRPLCISRVRHRVRVSVGRRPEAGLAWSAASDQGRRPARTQNSFPSGSAMTTQLTSAPWPTSACRAPRSSRRRTSSSCSLSVGLTSRWSLFLMVLPSGRARMSTPVARGQSGSYLQAPVGSQW